MTPRSPFAISLMMAVLASLAVVAALHLFPALGGTEVPMPLIAFTVLAVFVVAGIGGYVLVKRFVQARVDLIHRTVHGARSVGAGSVKAPNGDLLALDAEVSAWAGSKRSEVLELRERERFRREFIGNLAHELRTPTFSIQGYILTLLEGGLEDPKVNRKFLERASSGTERMVRIIEDLDLITQLESGVIGIAAEPMDLRKLVQEMMDDLRIPAQQRRVTLHNAMQDEVLVHADRDRLAQVLLNLLNNAIHYGKEGGSCTVRAFDIGEQVLVEVEDNGPGIAAEHLPRLFERFYRVGKSRARNEGGTGLGLSIVKHIIESHGGTIAVKSTEGQGTTFSFTLPAAR
ncbi:MAG: ATP-binding protein [Flavobacteriales bacterium]